MASMKKLKKDQALKAIKDQEFGKDVTDSAKHVAVILTQDWCPQWGSMHAYLKPMKDKPGTAIWYCEYNVETFYEDFLNLKEEQWKNKQIPYVRYYTDGKFKDDSNYVPEEKFLSLLGIKE
jgi:hypothetical protein